MKQFAFCALFVLLLASCVPKLPTESLGKPKKNGYELAFSDSFNPGRNYIDDLGISIVIAMDVSGSMGDVPRTGGEEKYLQATKALQRVAEFLSSLADRQKDIKIQVAVLKFSSSVTQVLPLTRLDDEGIRALGGIMSEDNFFPGGGTAIGSAIERGSEILAQSGTIFNSLIIVTDGENTVNPDPEKVIEAMYANRNNKSSEDLVVRTSSQLLAVIGFDINSPQFARFNEQGARIMSASNRSELETALTSLLEADITKLE